MFTRKYKIKHNKDEIYTNPFYNKVDREIIYTNNNYDFSKYNTYIGNNSIFNYFSDLITLCSYLVYNNEYQVFNLGNSNGIFEYILRTFFCIDKILNIGKDRKINKLNNQDLIDINTFLTDEITMSDLKLEYIDRVEEEYINNSIVFLFENIYNSHDYDNFINLAPVKFMISLNLNSNNKFKDLLITDKGYPKEEVIFSGNTYKLTFYYKLNINNNCYNLLAYESDKIDDKVYGDFFLVKEKITYKDDPLEELEESMYYTEL